MATTLKLRRGTTAAHSTFTGAAGEVTVDTDKDVVVVHDGTTAGGFPAIRAGGTVTASAGTVSAPAITTTGDTNTGIFFPAADTIAFSEGGVESMRISSDGRLQINGSNTLTSTLVGTANNFPLTGATTAYQFRAEATFNAANTSAVGFGSTYQFPSSGTFTSSYQFIAGEIPVLTGTAAVTNNYGVYVAAQTVGTNIYGVSSNIAAATDRWNFYAGGDADNYFAGNVGIGTNAPRAELNVNGAGGELIRISVTPDAGVIQEPALGFATGVANTHPAAKISALEFDASDSRASLLFYTRGSNSDVAPTLRMTIGSDGLVELASASGLSIGRTAVTSPAATDGNVFSGTYTPSLSNTTNITSSTPFASQYMRVGNVVTVSGRVTIDPTATGSITLGVSLPIASTFTAQQQCCGVSSNQQNDPLGIVADATNLRASFIGVVNDAASRTYSYSFTYQII